MNHTISFRRPELRHVLSTMTVPPGGNVPAQIRRLEDLGYNIIAVTPPLDVYGPTKNPHPLEARIDRDLRSKNFSSERR